MIIGVESFILYNIAMATFGWYLMKTHGEKEFEAGMVEGVLMHNEGRLTYKTYTEDGVEMVDIRIKPYED